MFQSLGDEFAQSLRLVRRDWKLYRLTAGRDHLCCQRKTVGIADLIVFGFVANGNNFVTSRKNRDLRPRIDMYSRLPDCGCKCDVGGRQAQQHADQERGKDDY